MAPHPARLALAGRRIDQDWHRHRLPGNPNLVGYLEDPAPQLLSIVDPVSRAIATDDEAMWRTNAQFLLNQQEVAPHLCPMVRPDLPRAFPLLDDDRAIGLDQTIRPPGQP